MTAIQGKAYFVHVEEAILAFGRAAGVFSSSTGLGRAREQLVRDGLVPHLPTRVAVERGEMIDIAGRTSGELDVIMTDHNRGRKHVGGESMVTVEGAIGAIEVKTSLKGGELASAIRKVAKVKHLQRGQHRGLYRASSPAVRGVVPPDRTMTFVVAYDAPQWDKILRNLEENPDWYDGDFMTYGPEVIAVLGRGVMLKNDLHYVEVDPAAANRVVVINRTIPSLQLLTEYVQEYLNRYGNLSYPVY